MADRKEATHLLGIAIAAVLGLTLWRVWGLAIAPTDLFVDEAQYWLWSRTPDFGYFSKPPLIAWAIGGATALGGSDAPFWVRLPAPLFHAATAFILMALARGAFGDRAAAWTGLSYITMPGVALGAAVISTDTMLFPFFAAALFGWVGLLSRPCAPCAFLTGLMLGIGFLGKYAALYFWIGAALGALLLRPPAWPGRRLFPLVLGGFLLAAAPNLIWNARQGGQTWQHTLDNADWVRDPAGRAGLNLDNLLEFVAAQFGIFGPVLFGVLIWAGLRALRGRAGRVEALMLLFAIPVIVLVSGQALVSRAYANWAAVAYLPGTVAVVVLLLARARWLLWVSLAINGAVALALPVALSRADSLTLGDRLVFARLIGRSGLSAELIAAARAAGAETIVAENRDVLADLFYTGRDSGLAFRARPLAGPPANHYAAAHPYAGDAALVLWVIEGAAQPACPGAAPALRQAPTDGAYAGKRFTAWAVPGDCPALMGTAGR
jgi:4-amino-4-deoxy-L-arabinose transferase-like glycosyltransferase